MENSVFQRYEIKYMTDDRQRTMLETAFGDRMRPDPHGESTICNVYYDTPDYRLIRASLDKPVYKEKLRMRSYGRVGREDAVFLELKKKFSGVVYKRRITLSEREAVRCMNNIDPLLADSQIGRELAYVKEFYKVLQPAVYLCYDRCAYYAKEDSQLRVSFDRNICWRIEDMALTSPTGGRRLIPPGQSVFEIKTASAIPLWLVRLMEELGIRQSSFSKYGEAYPLIMMERTGDNCA